MVTYELFRCWKYYLAIARRLGWCVPVTAELVVQLADERLLSKDCLYGQYHAYSNCCRAILGQSVK
jgi:hypothetical protein